jgi:argininosuccinate lyase
MKIWEKDKQALDAVMKFTVGNDPEYDRLLAPYDVLASAAHAKMLGECGLISQEEAGDLIAALKAYFPVVKETDFRLNEDDEDIHSHLEAHLIKQLGDTGKKIHTARSRNDQVMTALLLMLKDEWAGIIQETELLFASIMTQAKGKKDVLIPGYTHTQLAMPSSVGIWLGAYAESLINDLTLAKSVLEVLDQNPLGSAAGFGSSFPIDRGATTAYAGFAQMQVSAVSAQLNRGKMEALMGYGLSALAMTMNRLAADLIMYMNQNMAFVSFPDELTTGSSIMPHKKNPDVLELIRAHCNLVMQTPASLVSLTNNLVSGYHRDFQLTKELLVPAIQKTKDSLQMMALMIDHMSVREDILKDEQYKYLFTVESVNKLVMEGATFRDAYREVGREVEQGTYEPGEGQTHTHVGSIGNPGLEMIEERMKKVLAGLKQASVEDLLEKL